MELAYNPYSRFYVGACLIMDGANLIAGANVENAAYGSTICAERAAIMHANALGLRCATDIVIVARGRNFPTTNITAPCGACRQMLFELAQVSGCDMGVFMATTHLDKIMVATISELLPLAFGPVDIGVNVNRY
jgi:cytidine deaminase